MLKYKFLIVDDCELNRLVIKLMLNKLLGKNIIIDEKCDGLTTVMAIEDGADYDIIFMDIQMLVMDGLTCTSKIRDIGYTNPIIAVTSHADNNSITQCLECGITKVVTKPINKKQLQDILSEYLVQKFSTYYQQAYASF